jgi:hypothetical protein
MERHGRASTIAKYTGSAAGDEGNYRPSRGKNSRAPCLPSLLSMLVPQSANRRRRLPRTRRVEPGGRRVRPGPTAELRRRATAGLRTWQPGRGPPTRDGSARPDAAEVALMLADADHGRRTRGVGLFETVPCTASIGSGSLCGGPHRHVGVLEEYARRRRSTPASTGAVAHLSDRAVTLARKRALRTRR